MTVLGASNMNMTMNMGGGGGLAVASVTPAAQARFNTADPRKLVTRPPPSASPSSARAYAYNDFARGIALARHLKVAALPA